MLVLVKANAGIDNILPDYKGLLRGVFTILRWRKKNGARAMIESFKNGAVALFSRLIGSRSEFRNAHSKAVAAKDPSDFVSVTGVIGAYMVKEDVLVRGSSSKRRE